MIDGHRKQISESESGMAGSVLDRHKKVKQSIGDSMKLAMTAMQPPAEPQIQQKWRGRPPKAKDTTTVMGAMQDTNSMLAQASTTAGPAQ